MTAARRWAAQILECAPLAIRASKEVASQSLDLPLSEALSKVFPSQKTLFQSEDAVEGPKAFAAKRKPQWKGR
jgi:crotonobetainyl-CoA hydratase